MLKLPIPSLAGLRTERLLFRHASLEDRTWWMEYHESAEAIRYMPFTLGSTADCTRFIQWTLDRISRDGSCLNAIVERSTSKPVAMVGLLTQEVEGTTELEIGYHVLPSAWGKGYATEAAIACRKFAQQHRLAPSVVSLIDRGNSKSVAVAERNGMRYERNVVHREEEVMLYRVQLT